MIHLGGYRSTIIQGHFRGREQQLPRPVDSPSARNFSQCDSMLIGSECGAHTFPYIDVQNPTARMEHEATTSKIGEDQIFYCNSRGIDTEDAVSMIVNGFCKEVFRELPMEFAVEAQKLLAVSLEGSVGDPPAGEEPPNMLLDIRTCTPRRGREILHGSTLRSPRRIHAS
jgi:Fe-S cluster assembly protein SufB